MQIWNVLSEYGCRPLVHGTVVGFSLGIWVQTRRVVMEVFTSGCPPGDLSIDSLWPDFEVDEDVAPSGTSVCVRECNCHRKNDDGLASWFTK